MRIMTAARNATNMKRKRGRGREREKGKERERVIEKESGWAGENEVSVAFCRSIYNFAMESLMKDGR